MDKAIIFQRQNDKISIEALYCIGGYITYEVVIFCNGFSGKCNFCIAEHNLNELIKKIKYMYENLSGEVEIQDCESDAYLKIFFMDSMNMFVQGQIGGSYEDNTLKFKLKADQTILYGLKDKLLGYEAI